MQSAHLEFDKFTHLALFSSYAVTNCYKPLHP